MAKTTAASKQAKGKPAPRRAAAPKAKPVRAGAKPARPGTKPGARKPPPAPKIVAKPAPKLPATAVKPKKPGKPSLPPPPPTVPAAPPLRDELSAPRDVGRLLRYGERFGAHKIDIRWVTQQLPTTSDALAVCDPGAPKTWRVLDRPVAPGAFRVMLSVARTEGKPDRLAALVVHVGRPPIARWTVAHYRGQRPPKSPEQLPRLSVTTGWIALADAGGGSPGAIAVPAAPGGTAPIEVPLTDGRRALAVPCGDGDYAAYWAVDAADKPICLVLDFDVFSQKDWKAKPA